jgi:hypothetical protein
VRRSGILPVFLLVGLTVLLLFSSCGDKACDTCGREDQPEYARISPDSLFLHLAESFWQRRPDWYEDCLAEDFVFELTEEIAEYLGLPDAEPWLDRATDVKAVKKMLTDTSIDDVGFDFVAVGEPGDGEEEGTLVYKTTPDIVITVACPSEEPITYVVNHSWLEITVSRDPADEDLWIIRKIKEIPFPATGSDACEGTRVTMMTRGSTLSSVKAMWVIMPGTMRSVEEALDDYAGSIEAKDIETYADCLDYDHRFIFTDEIAWDMGLPPDAPWWEKKQDLAAMTNMFGDPYVVSITFEYTIVERRTILVGGRMATKVRTRPDIRLTYVRSETEPTIFLVKDSYLDFEFVARGHCWDRWDIVSVEEICLPYRSLESAGMPGTWSMIKSMFAPK